MEKISIVPNGSYSHGRNWIIRRDSDQYLVGFYSRRDITFIELCRCDFYDHAELICDTLRGHTPDTRILDYCEGGYLWEWQ